MTIAGSRHFSQLVQDYLTNFDGTPIREFFAVSPYAKAGELRNLANELVARASTDAGRSLRSILVHELRKQHQQAGTLTEAVEKNLARLAKPTTLAVVTGQQVGILGGPLYTVYKAFSAIALANELDAGLEDHDVVPIFWQETEDHDIDEATHYGIFDTNGQYLDMTYEYGEDAKRRQVGSLLIDEQTIFDMFHKMRDILAFTEFPVFKQFKEFYQGGMTFATAQAKVLGSLTGDEGLLILNANTRELKASCASLFRKELTSAPQLQEVVRGQSANLASHYHTQLDPSPVNLFIIDVGRRFKLEKDEDGFRYDAKKIGSDELERLIVETPECLSPNVVLRPLFQDSILPTIAYVAGPGEIAYYAQLRSAYVWAGIPMPLIAPRFSATIVEEKVRKNIEKAGGKVVDLIEQGDKAINNVLTSEKETEIANTFDTTSRKIEAELELQRSIVNDTDRSLDAALTNLKGKILTLVKEFASKTVGAERKKSSTLRLQLERSASLLLPQDKLQERAIGLLYYANKYGAGFIDGLKKLVLRTPRSGEHFLVNIGDILDSAELPPDKSR